MKTQQTGSEIPPSVEDDTLAIIIKCPGCDTQRAFRANNTIMLALTRQSSGCEYNTECLVCKRRIAVQLVWTKRHLGWVVEKITFQSTVTVEDEFIMTKTQGERQI